MFPTIRPEQLKPKLKSQLLKVEKINRRLYFTTEGYFVRGLLCQLCFQTAFSVILYKLLTTLKTKGHQDDRDYALLMVRVAYEASGFFFFFFSTRPWVDMPVVPQIRTWTDDSIFEYM